MATKRLDYIVSEKGTSKVAGGFKNVDRSIASAAKSAATYAAAYIGVRGIISITKQAIEAFGVQEQAEKRLSTALGYTNKALLAQASALQKVTTFGDETIITQQAFLASLAFTEEQIKDIIPVALDLAAATGQTLEFAVRNIAKTYAGLTGELGELIPQLKDLTVEELKSGKAIESISALMGGQAAAAAQTMAGSIQQAKNAVGDAAEAIGELLSPAVIKLSKELQIAADKMSGVFDALNNKGQKKTIEELADEMIYLHDIWSALPEDTGGFDTKALWFEKLLKATNEYKAAVEAAFLAEQISVSVRTRGVEATELQLDALIDLMKYTEQSTAQIVDLSSIMSQALGNAFDPNMEKGDAFKQFVIQFLSLLQGVILASEAVSTALTFTFTGPAGIAAAIGALTALEGAKALVRNVQFAATGADFTTTGPQLLMVGEAGREHVSVTPLEGPNINGPQGGNTFIFNGPVTSRQFVRDELIPEFMKASRLGYA